MVFFSNLVLRIRSRLSQSSELVLLGGTVAVVGALVLMALLAAGNWRSEQASQLSHAEFLARVLEDQATRTIESAQLAMGALTESPALRAGSRQESPGADQQRMGPALQQALFGLSFLRTLAVLDGQGTVLASTQPSDVGLQLDLQRLGASVRLGRGQLGSLVQGRGLASVQRHGGPVTVPAGVAFLPMLLGFSAEGGDTRILVGLLNPDAFASFHHLALDSDRFESAITSYQGMVLATSAGDVAEWSGKQVRAIPVFTRYLPKQEHGQYQGPGIVGDKQLLAFRVSSSQPLVVIVEQSQQRVFWEWVRGLRGVAAIGVLLVLLIAVLTFAVWRGVRQREADRMAADLAQLRITRSQRDLSMLMRSVQEFIFWTDREGVITFANARWPEFSGQATGSAVGTQLRDITFPSCHLALSDAFDPESSQGVRHCPVLVRSGDGMERHFDMAIVPLRMDGKIQGFVGSAVDVTDRWVAEQRLQDQIHFQRILLENSPLPIAVTDANGLIVQVNKAWEEYKGRRREDVVGKVPAGFLPPDEAKVHRSADNQVLRWGGSTQFETLILGGDGKRHDTRVVKAALTDDSERVTGVLTILMDVSEFREAERATEEARHAAEEASRTKSEFVANMSHELRTPLQSILGFAELGMLRSRSEPKLAGMFEDIHSAGNRMLRLVNDLLEVSKLESAVGTFHMERVDLRGVMRPVVRELEPLLVQKQVHLQVGLPDMPLVAKADPMRFQQVVRNVVANAIKFSPEGGTIRLVGHLDSEGQAHVVVEDEGPGIPEKELETIFESFVQSSKTKDGSGGTGLGLAICKTIVEAMGGRIYATNTPKGGAAFHIVLPARGSMETRPAELEYELTTVA